MKKPSNPSLGAVIVLTFFLFVSASTNAQTSYDFTASSGTFTPLTGSTSVAFANKDDGLSDEISLPFSFSYFGVAHSSLKISTNGYLTFDVTSSTSDYSNYLAFAQSPLICPLWDDLSGDLGVCSYLSEGSAGNKIFTVEYLNWQWDYNSTESTLSFQVKLYESNGKIEFIYRQESGAATNPSASIGLASGVDPDFYFYSLSDASSSPLLSMDAVNDIASKPATNQLYSFVPGAAPVAPGTQATSVTASAVTGTSMHISWVNGNGANRAVFMKSTTSTSDVVPLTNGTRYYDSPVFGDYYVTASWYCVYNGSGSSVDVTNLESDTQYRIQVVEYNGITGNQAYQISTNGTNPVNATTLLAAPSSPASTIALAHVGTRDITMNVNDGDGKYKAVFMKAGNSGNPPVVDNTTYEADMAFESGDQIGSSGWYCVLNDEFASTFTVTNLLPNTEYRIAVVDYNGSPGVEKYHVVSVTNNPVQIVTYQDIPTAKNYTLSASSGTYTDLSGATAVDQIETDDILSSSIPIGFTFKFGGVNYNQLKISSNGFLTFNPYANSSGTSFNYLSGTVFSPVIAPLWDDLSGNSGQASYQTTGTAGSRIFVVEFKNWNWNWTALGATISFQIRLYEGTNKVEYIYRPEVTLASSPSASIGLSFTDIGDFLSLNNTGSSPTASSVAETSTLSTKPASGQIYTFTPPKQDQTITFDTPPSKVFGDAAFNLTASSDSNLPVSFSSSNTNVATISGNTLTIVGAGTISIIASQSGNNIFNAAPSVERSFTVTKANQTVTFEDIPVKKYGSGDFQLNASTTSHLALTYSSSNTDVATISGNTVSIVGLGSTDITANQVGSTNYNSASSMKTFIVVKGDQVITFSPIESKWVGAGTFTLGASSNANLSISYESSNTAVATISGNTVTIKGMGTTNIKASQAGNALYNAAPEVTQQLVVTAKQSQVITFTELEDKHYGDAPFLISATANSGLTLTFSSSNTGVATVSGSTITIVAPGTSTITATQGGNDEFFEASVERSLTVKKGLQTISLEAFAAKKHVGDVINLADKSSANLPVIYESSNPDVATVSGSTLTVTGGGSTTITASQSGNTFYESTSVSHELTVLKSQTITLTPIGDRTLGEAPFQLKAVASSGLPIIFSVNSERVVLEGDNKDFLALLEPGSVTITVTQAGNDVYDAAPPVVETICIKPIKPAITVSPDESGIPVLNSGFIWPNQWFRDGIAIEGENESTTKAIKSGSYTVQITKNDCSSLMSDAEVILITGTESSDVSIKLYPNPAGNYFVVDLTEWSLKRPAEVSITDMSGKQLQSWLGKGKITCNIEGLSQGNYIVNVKAGKSRLTRQLSKK
jgi:hypothetical protein